MSTHIDRPRGGLPQAQRQSHGHRLRPVARAVLRPLIACLLLAFAACAPAAVSPAPEAEWAADRAEIMAALQGSAAAWNEADLRGHLAIYVDSVTFMTREGPRPGVEPVFESFTRSYWREGRPVQQLGFDEVNVRPLDRNAALVTGRFRLTGGDQPQQSGWFTLVWVRTAEGWKAVHDHSS